MGAACKACASDNSTPERNIQNRPTNTNGDDDTTIGTETNPSNEEKIDVNNQDKSDGSYKSNEVVLNSNNNTNNDEKQGFSELNTYVNQNDDPQTSKTDLPQNYVPETNVVEEIDDNPDPEDELIVPLKTQVEVQDMSEQTRTNKISAMNLYMERNLVTDDDISQTCIDFVQEQLLKFQELDNTSDFSNEDVKNSRRTIRKQAVAQWREQHKDIDEDVLEKQVQYIERLLEDDRYDSTFSLGASARPNIQEYNENEDEKLEVENELTPQEPSINIVTDDDFDDNTDNNNTNNNNDNENENQEETANDNNDDNKENSDPQEPNTQSNEEVKENNENNETYDENQPQEEQPTTDEQPTTEEQPPEAPTTDEQPTTEEPQTEEQPEIETNNENNDDNKDNSEPQPDETPPQENYEPNNEEQPTEEKPEEDLAPEEPIEDTPNEENNYETGTVEPPKEEPEPEPQPEPEPEPAPVNEE